MTTILPAPREPLPSAGAAAEGQGPSLAGASGRLAGATVADGAAHIRPAGAILTARLLGPDGAPARTSFLVRLAGTPGLAVPGSAAAGAAPAVPPAVPAAAGVPPVVSASALPAGHLPDAGLTLEAEALGRDRLGRVLLRTDGLTLRIEEAADLPIGARLKLVLVEGVPAPEPAADEGSPLDILVRGLIAGLIKAPDGKPLCLPRPDETLAASLLRLIRAWDDQVSNRERAASDGEETGASGIGRALKELAELAREPLPGGWRALLLPLGLGEETQMLKLYLRAPWSDHRGEGGEEARHAKDAQETPRRAVFEAEFSRLGRCQLDVLWRAARCDLLLRTAQPLVLELRHEIGAIFLAACELAGLAGGVAFRPCELLRLPEAGSAMRRPALTV